MGKTTIYTTQISYVFFLQTETNHYYIVSLPEGTPTNHIYNGQHKKFQSETGSEDLMGRAGRSYNKKALKIIVMVIHVLMNFIVL